MITYNSYVSGGLTRSAANLPGVLEEWYTLEDGLREVYANALNWMLETIPTQCILHPEWKDEIQEASTSIFKTLQDYKFEYLVPTDTWDKVTEAFL